jgi:hypothetical protein
MQIGNAYRISVPKHLGGIPLELPRTLKDKSKMDPRKMGCEAGRDACIIEATTDNSRAIINMFFNGRIKFSGCAALGKKFWSWLTLPFGKPR